MSKNPLAATLRDDPLNKNKFAWLVRLLKDDPKEAAKRLYDYPPHVTALVLHNFLTSSTILGEEPGFDQRQSLGAAFCAALTAEYNKEIEAA